VDLLRGAGRQDAADTRLVQLRMEIVDDDALLRVAVGEERRRQQRASGTQELATGDWKGLVRHALFIGTAALGHRSAYFLTNLCRSGFTVSATQISPCGPMAM